MDIKASIEIAVLTPGDNSVAAEEARNMLLGAELAVRELNAAGGLVGEEIHLTRCDTGDMTPASVVNAVSRLIFEGRTQAAVTGFASTSAFEIELMADAGIPYLVAEHALQLQRRISADPGRYETVWGLLPSYDPYGEETAKKLIQLSESVLERCRRRVFLINADNEYSSRCAEGIALGLVRDGWTIVGGLTVQAGQILDWELAIGDVKDGDVDLVVSTDHLATDAAALSRAFSRLEIRALLFIQYGPRYPEYLDLAGESANGVFFNVLGGPIDALRGTQDLRTRFFAAYGFYPDRYGIDTYQAVQLYAEAVSSLGSPWDTRAIGRHVGQLRREMAQGTVSFDPRTHLARTGANAVPMQWYQYREGMKVCFAPDAFATGNFELPPWLAQG